jgi:hypothetical protein
MKLTRQQLQAQIDALKYIVLTEVPALNEAKLNLLLDFATLNESAQQEMVNQCHAMFAGKGVAYV